MYFSDAFIDDSLHRGAPSMAINYRDKTA